jgi:hypothetical protein
LPTLRPAAGVPCWIRQAKVWRKVTNPREPALRQRGRRQQGGSSRGLTSANLAAENR